MYIYIYIYIYTYIIYIYNIFVCMYVYFTWNIFLFAQVVRYTHSLQFIFGSDCSSHWDMFTEVQQNISG